jgi:magnesium-transporting ATPase (P-type)
MEPLGQYVSEQSEPRNFESAFFERRPLRSYYFIAGTIMMGMDFALVALVLFRSWSQMATFAIGQIGLAAFAMLALWSRAYTTWQRFHELYSQAKLSPSFARSPLDTSLRNAAAITGAALFFSYFLAAWLLLALAYALRGR